MAIEIHKWCRFSRTQDVGIRIRDVHDRRRLIGCALMPDERAVTGG
jgi:uncharacterized membrane protein